MTTSFKHNKWNLYIVSDWHNLATVLFSQTDCVNTNSLDLFCHRKRSISASAAEKAHFYQCMGLVALSPLYQAQRQNYEMLSHLIYSKLFYGSHWLHYVMGLLPDTQNCGLRIRQECRERFPRHRLQRKPLVNDPGMHHGTCVTHVPWCMSGLLNRGGGEIVPNIPGACATRIFEYLARCPWSQSKPVGPRCNDCFFVPLKLLKRNHQIGIIVFYHINRISGVIPVHRTFWF